MRHRERIQEVLCLTLPKTVHFEERRCLRELIQEDDMNQGSSGDKLNDKEARVYRITAAKLLGTGQA